MLGGIECAAIVSQRRKAKVDNVFILPLPLPMFAMIKFRERRVTSHIQAQKFLILDT